MGRSPLAEGQASVTASIVVKAITRQAYEALAEAEEAATGTPTTLSSVMRRALEDWLVGRTRHDVLAGETVRKKYNLSDLPEE